MNKLVKLSLIVYLLSFQAHIAKLAKESIERNRSDDLKLITRRAEQREEELNILIDTLEAKHGEWGNDGLTCGNLTSVSSEYMLRIKFMSTSYEMALSWMPQNTIGDNSALVGTMAWCRQSTTHYLSQCVLRSISPYGVTRPQRVSDALDKRYMFS